MAILLNEDPNTGLTMDNMYYRIDKINFNDRDFQIVMTGYASEEAFRNGALPISEPRAYTFGNYGKENIPEIFAFAYNLIKLFPDFKNATDAL